LQPLAQFSSLDNTWALQLLFVPPFDLGLTWSICASFLGGVTPFLLCFGGTRISPLLSDLKTPPFRSLFASSNFFF
jgi:hypothetical protein